MPLLLPPGDTATEYRGARPWLANSGAFTFTDIFCGLGGASLGLALAGGTLRLAANHWDRAIETHSANFPHADHLLADVSNYDMRRLPKTNVLWASPICTELSPAGGNRRPTGQTDILEELGHVPKAAYERTRATFWDVIRATEVHRYDYVLIENVVEAARWVLFEVWLSGMVKLGYSFQAVCVSSAHIGGDDNDPAPQWRDRMFLAFTRDGLPVPDVAPRPLAPCFECGVDVQAVQSWKKQTALLIGKYRSQYVYRCPNSACRNSVVEPYINPVSTIIDWSNLGTRIGDRKKPLVAATMRRIQVGLDTFFPNGVPAVDPPFPTLIGAARRNSVMRPADSDAAQALNTARHNFIATPGAFVSKHHGGLDYAAIEHMNKSVHEPLPTAVARPNLSLVLPYRKGAVKTTDEPVHTMATKDSARLVRPAVAIEDCHTRMLTPREAARAQRIPDEYKILGNAGEQQMQAGNAVSSNVAQWFGSAVAAAYAS